MIISGTYFTEGDWESYTYTQFMIQSISVINNTTIDVTYTDDFDDASALNKDNYSLKGTEF